MWGGDLYFTSSQTGVENISLTSTISNISTEEEKNISSLEISEIINSQIDDNPSNIHIDDDNEIHNEFNQNDSQQLLDIYQYDDKLINDAVVYYQKRVTTNDTKSSLSLIALKNAIKWHHLIYMKDCYKQCETYNLNIILPLIKKKDLYQKKLIKLILPMIKFNK